MKALETLQTLLHNFSENDSLRHFKTIFETTEGIIFGSREVTPEAPHFLDHIEIKRYMSTVIISLLPTTFAAIYFFGWQALRIIIASYIAGGIVEVLFALIRNKEIEEGFLVTVLIFPLTLPPTIPTWMVKRNFVVTDDFVVEVGNVNMAIRSKTDVDRPKPGIIAGHEVGQLAPLGGRADKHPLVAIDPRSHHIAADHLAAQRHERTVGWKVLQTTDRSTAVQMFNHRR